MGTAYLTPIAPRVYTTADDVAAVYAIWPLAVYKQSCETAFVLVASSSLVGDTVVHPCDRAGEMLAFDLLAHVTVRNHRAALHAAGYELEVAGVSC